MIKIKHARTADCVVAGFRWHKNGEGDAASARCCSGCTTTRARCITSASRRRSRWRRAGAGDELAPLREHALDDHPWREWAERGRPTATRMPGGQSRWSAGKDLSWEPLRIERVCEVKYDHLQGDRFRHAAIFLRWRPDKPPRDCRYDQLEVTTPYELEKVFGGGAASSALSPRQSSRIVVGIERFLRRPQLSGTCCRLTRMRVQVVKRPRIASTSTSAGCEMRRRLGMARLPALEPRQRVVLSLARADLDRADGFGRRARRDGCDARRLARLLAVVRRPRRIALPLASRAAPTARAARRASTRASSIAACRSPIAREARRHRRAA